MKNLSLLLVLQLASFQLWSQLMVTPIAGANITKVHFTEGPFESNPALRYFIGFQTSYQLSEKFSAGLGLQYATKGYTESTDKPALQSDARLQYVELVPFAAYRLNRHLGLMAGGGIGLLSNESYLEINDWIEPSFDIAETLDLYVLFGARYYYGKAFLSLTFNHSVSSVLDYKLLEGGGSIKDGKTYSQVLSLGVGYHFNLIKK